MSRTRRPRFTFSNFGKSVTKAALLALPALALLLIVSTANADLRVNDTWKDDDDSTPASPVYSENGTDADADADLESAWFQGGVGTLDPVAGGGPGPLRGDMLTTTGTSSASWTTYFTPEASPITLSSAGHAMRVTWQFTLTDVGANNTSQNFRFAIVDTPGAARLVANGSPGTAAYTGYGIFANMSATTLGNSNPFQLRERVVASGAMLSAAADWGANGVANVGLANGATTGNAGYTAGVLYSLVWTMTRNSSAGLDHAITLSGGTLDGDGSASIAFTDTSPNGFSYDTFSIRPTSPVTTARLFDTSLFRVEAITAIPEAASALTWAVIGLTCCTRRWRRVAR